MDRIELWAAECKKNKDNVSHNKFISTLGSAVQVGALVLCVFSKNFNFIHMLGTWFAAEFMEKFLQQKDSDEQKNALISKMHLETVENMVVSRYVLQKMLAIDSDSYYAGQRIVGVENNFLKDTIKSLTARARKFKQQFEDNTFSQIDIKPFVEENRQSILQELDFFEISPKTFFQDVQIKEKTDLTDLNEKISLLQSKSLSTEQASQLSDVVRDRDMIAQLAEKIASMSNTQRAEAQKSIAQITENCVHTLDNLETLSDTEVGRELKRLEAYTEQRKMRMGK